MSTIPKELGAFSNQWGQPERNDFRKNGVFQTTNNCEIRSINPLVQHRLVKHPTPCGIHGCIYIHPDTGTSSFMNDSSPVPYSTKIVQTHGVMIWLLSSIFYHRPPRPWTRRKPVGNSVFSVVIRGRRVVRWQLNSWLRTIKNVIHTIAQTELRIKKRNEYQNEGGTEKMMSANPETNGMEYRVTGKMKLNDYARSFCCVYIPTCWIITSLDDCQKYEKHFRYDNSGVPHAKNEHSCHELTGDIGWHRATYDK